MSFNFKSPIFSNDWRGKIKTEWWKVTWQYLVQSKCHLKVAESAAGLLNNSKIISFTNEVSKCFSVKSKQGHHHNGDQAARWLHVLCSICIHPVGISAKADMAPLVASQCVIKFALLIFSSSPNDWLHYERGTFRPSSLGIRGAEVWDGPIQ